MFFRNIDTYRTICKAPVRTWRPHSIRFTVPVHVFGLCSADVQDSVQAEIAAIKLQPRTTF
jgi:hypothetical protein